MNRDNRIPMPVFIIVCLILIALLPAASVSAKDKGGVEWKLNLFGVGERAIAPSIRAGSVIDCADISLRATKKGAKITKVTIAVKNSDDETVAKKVLKPNSGEYTLEGNGYINEKIAFKELEPGEYRYVVSVKVSSNKKAVRIVDEKFTVYSKKKADKLKKKILADAMKFLDSAGYSPVSIKENAIFFCNHDLEKNDGWKYVWYGSILIDCGCVDFTFDLNPGYEFNLASVGTKDIGKWLEGYLKDTPTEAPTTTDTSYPDESWSWQEIEAYHDRIWDEMCDEALPYAESYGWVLKYLFTDPGAYSIVMTKGSDNELTITLDGYGGVSFWITSKDTEWGGGGWYDADYIKKGIRNLTPD